MAKNEAPRRTGKERSEQHPHGWVQLLELSDHHELDDKALDEAATVMLQVIDRSLASIKHHGDRIDATQAEIDRILTRLNA